MKTNKILNLTNYFRNTEMVKYTYKTVAYVLPESIKKINNDVRLHRAQSEKEQIKRDIANKNEEINNATGSEKKRLERERDELTNKLTKIENNIFNIKADLYGSTVNFSNNNIQQLSANINDISSFIKGNPNFNENITKNISEILSNQIDVKSIFDGVNFKDMLQKILDNTDEVTKNNYIDKFNKIKAVFESIKEDSDSEKNKQFWNDIKEDIKDLIPADKLEKILEEKQKQIRDLEYMKQGLNKLFFDKDTKDVDLKELDVFNKKSNLLKDLYDDLKNSGIVNKVLQRQANDKENKGRKIINIEDGANIKKIFGINSLKKEQITEAINNMRKWFTNDAPDFKEIKDSKLFTSIKDFFDYNLLRKDNLEKIEEEDIKIGNIVLKTVLAYYNKDNFKDFFKNETQTNNSEENVSQGLRQRQYISKGLDLDEIHNMNIMNGIINSMNVVNKSLDNIIYNQNRIIELISKQNISQSKQSFSERKLGRFKVEKYNPNMSITEFKKLFDKK